MELLQTLDPLTASAIGGAIGSIILMLLRQYLITQREDQKTAEQLLHESRKRGDDLRRENARKQKIIHQLRAKNFELKKKLEKCQDESE